MFIFLMMAALLSSVAIGASNGVRNDLYHKYNAPNKNSSEPINNHYTPNDEIILQICDIVEAWSIPIFLGLCSMLSSFVFYRHKLKKPIALLGMASEKIANHDLNFHIHYESKDEMGKLCDSFEKMRAALDDNTRQMWRSMEERKQLNAVFSHDLRTPLTVLRGSTDFLVNYLPQGKISADKVMSTVSAMSAHILRLENYVQLMSEIQRLEDSSIYTTNVNIDHFIKQLNSIAEVLVEGRHLKMTFENHIAQTELHFDADTVIRIFENMLSNAIRYADKTISIGLESMNGMLCITVSDDGEGFSEEDLEQATKPFYKRKAINGSGGFGLGLHICKILSEKHGGGLRIANNETCGARVTVMFQCKSTNTPNIDIR
ncbi:HAMP domain-containing sensor histidine kinase [Paenibacillus sp. FSL W7-1279]|uniref:HAMP domain-containing sensor histidine kinase n=2 Tax=Paenibacillus TaxID=44249 RepID=UPI0030DD51B2